MRTEVAITAHIGILVKFWFEFATATLLPQRPEIDGDCFFRYSRSEKVTVAALMQWLFRWQIAFFFVYTYRILLINLSGTTN